MGTYGPKATSAPAGAIILNPGDNISAIVSAAPAGATFYFEPGVYRGVSLAPKDGQTFVGAEGAILNGSAVLTNWTQSGNLWVIGGQTQQGRVNSSAEFLPGTQRPGNPETVFLDNTPLKPVDALSKVVPGTFYFDYAADKIYIADNPTGHTVEAGKQTDAFHGSAKNVTVQNLVIEKYDPMIQDGAISGDQSWTIRDNEARLNYAVGITAHDGSQIIGNYVHDNGQMGVGGYGNNVLVQGNELASNGFWSGIDPLWEAGGLKFAETNNLVVQGNYVHDNNGPGLWSDIDSINTLYEDNVVVHNTISGIAYEISYNAIIRNNTLIDNGYGDTRGWGWGAEINIQNSQNVQVYGNQVDMTGGGNGIVLIQQNRGSGAYGLYTTTGNQIHDNIIVDRDGHGSIGGFADYNPSGMLNGGNTWSNNQYFMSDGGSRFEWVGAKNFAQFKAATHETGSISQSYPDTSGWLTGSPAATAGSPAATITARLANDTGSSSTDGITSNPTLTGTGAANAVVHFTVDGSAIAGTTTADASGAWNFTPTALGNGSHTVGVSETAAGNTTSTSLTFTLDTTAPAITSRLANDTGSSSTDRITSNPTLTGTGAANAVVHFTVDGSAIAPTTTADASGAWSFTPTALGNGSHTVVASETDAAGNTASTSLTFTLDNTAAAITARLANDTGSSSTDRITSDPTLTGAGAANAVVHFTVDGSAIAGTATADASGAWSFTPTALGNGSHTVVASETDAAGNAGSASLTFTLDNTAAAITARLANDTGSSSTDRITSDPTLTGTGAANAVVHFTIDGSAIAPTTTADASGAWSFTPTALGNGSHTVVASQTDAAGNTASTSLTFTLDTTAPAITSRLANDTGSSSTDRITSDPTLTGTGAANAVVHFTIDGSAIAGTATADASGAWSFTPTALGNGSHTVVASETDAAGNAGSASLTFTLDYDCARYHLSSGQRYRIVVDRQDHVEPHPDRHWRRQRRRSLHGRRQRHRRHRHRRRIGRLELHADCPRQRVAYRRRQRDRRRRQYRQHVAHFHARQHRGRHHRAPGQRYWIVVDRQDHVEPHPDRHRRRQRRRSLHGRRQRHRPDHHCRRVGRLELHTDRPRQRVAHRRRQRDRRRRQCR